MYAVLAGNASNSPFGSAMVTGTVSLIDKPADSVFLDPAKPEGADGVFFTADDGLMPAKGSALIDSGVVTTPPLPFDLLGQTRIGAYDIGAFEYGHQVSSVSVSPLAASRPYSVYPNPSAGRFILRGGRGARYTVFA